MIKWHKAKNGCRGGRMEGSLQKLSDEQLCTLASGGDYGRAYKADYAACGSESGDV